MNIEELKEVSKVIRSLVISTILERGEGHLGSCLSIVDILCVLFLGGHFRFIDLLETAATRKDFLVLSKAHG